MLKFNKLLAFLLAAVCLFSSCKNQSENQSTAPVLPEKPPQVLYYWQDVAYIYNIGEDLTNCDYTAVFEIEAESINQKAEQIIAYSLLERSGINISKYKNTGYESQIKEILQNGYKNNDVKTTALCVFASIAANWDSNYSQIAKYFNTLADKQSGGFYKNSDTAITDTESTSYALHILALFKTENEDIAYDGALIYLGEKINKNNTLSDINGKENAISTALVLSAFLTAGLPFDGEISTALNAAIEREFKAGNGYSEFKNGENSKIVTSEVLLCKSFIMYDSIWVNLLIKDGKTVEINK